MGGKDSLAREFEQFLVTIKKMPSGERIAPFLYNRFLKLLQRAEPFLDKDTGAWDAYDAAVNGREEVEQYIVMEQVLRSVLLGLGRSPPN